MSILDRFRSKSQANPEILTKAPGFAVTRFTSGNPFTNLIYPETNYFEQYILYVAKCIDYVSSKVASSKVHLYSEADQVIDDNELFQDLKTFNPYMTLWEARKLKEMHLYLAGAAFWYVDRDPQVGKRAEFYPLDPNHVTMRTDERGLPGDYQYTDADGKVVTLPREDVIYFRRMKPSNWFEGESILKTMQFWSNAYAQGAQYNMNKLGNESNVDKFIVFEGISDSQRDKLDAMLANKYNGPRNAGRRGVVNLKPEIVDVSSNQKDMDYVMGMKMLREDIMAAFGIPEALFFPSATNANSKEAVRLFQSDTLEPLMEQEKSVFNEQLIPKYGAVRAKSGNVFFGYEPVVDQDKNELVAQAKQMVDAGVFTRDQALIYIGQEPIGGELGGMYLNNIGAGMGDGEADDGVKALQSKTKALSEQLDKLLEERDRDEFIRKNAKLADDQEGIMYASAESLFQQQFKDVVEYINKADKPSVRGIFNHSEAVETTKQIFRESYSKVMGNSNDVANVEIKQKLLQKNSNSFAGYRVKALSSDALSAIEKKLSYFADELNDVTQKKLRKLVAEGVETGFDKTEFRNAVQHVFNSYIDGEKNIDTLEKHGFYIPSISTTIEGDVVVSSGNRYNAMLEKITQAQSRGEITKSEMDDALAALRGLIDPSDPLGKTVDQLLSSLYGVNKNESISYSRAVTIARTEATYARNLGFDDTYNNNPFIKGKTWSAALDKDTRESHGIANGKTVLVDEAFTVGDSRLRFPGDTSLGAKAGEIVNCRCRIVAEVID